MKNEAWRSKSRSCSVCSFCGALRSNGTDFGVGGWSGPQMRGRHSRSAARANDLAGPPAAGFVAARRSGTDGVAFRVVVDRLPGAELLGVAVPGKDFEQRLLVGLLRGRQLLVERGARRRVEAPGRAVR